VRNAHSIARTGLCRVRGPHLVAVNQACPECTNTCGEGRECDRSTRASQAAVFGPVIAIGTWARTRAWILRHLVRYLLAALVAFALAAAPALLDGQGPDATELQR
jgi:hypothetical protein